jgi:tetrahydromethanopterin S-methyltransferase subunit A
MERLAARAPAGLAIVGTLRTENLGIERLIRNVLASPALRALVLCGEDAQEAVGHLAGASLESLFSMGVDLRGRIRGAPGKRPVLRNVGRVEVEAFLGKVELVSLVGERDEEKIGRAVARAAARPPSRLSALAPKAPASVAAEVVVAAPPRRLVSDPAGWFVVYPDHARRRLLLEHYTTAGALHCVIEGETPAAVAAEAIERQLLSRLDHAAYLGRELARAERCLSTGERYEQDRAPGEIEGAGCGCAGGCGERPTR